MLQKSFVVAMGAQISFGHYHQPTAIVRSTKKWLIVSRLGADGEYLTLSIAGAMTHPSDAAPIGIRPVKTLAGILLSDSDSDFESTFLLVRQIPPLLNIAGTFFPADGYARVSAPAAILTLASEGRFAHTRGRQDRLEIRKDVPDPAPNAREAMAWHASAVKCAWVGEFVQPARERPPVPIANEPI